METAAPGTPGDAMLGDSTRKGAAESTWKARDLRRTLQLALATIWLLDAVLQLQPSMFTRGFAQMLASSSHGNPAAVGAPITWAAHIVSQHAQVLDGVFAAIQLLLAIGIAWPRTTRVAMGASIAWALAVWWFGEGLGGLLAGSANLGNGGPGAALLYALVAVVAWPAQARDVPGERFVASRPLGTARARALWLLLWLTIGLFALHSSAAMIGPIQGQPLWLVWLDHRAAALLARDRAQVSLGLAALCAVVALAVFFPPALMRLALAAALVAIALIWIVAQDLGGILAGSATDPSSGPLLALFVLAYWPRRPSMRRALQESMRACSPRPGEREDGLLRPGGEAGPDAPVAAG